MEMLAAAKEHDAPKLESLIAQLEIPNYQDWFTRTFGEEIGQRQSENYGRNLADSSVYVEALFTQWATEDGEFTIRKANLRAEGGEPGDSPSPMEILGARAAPFVVIWKNRGLSGSPGLSPISRFVFLDGSFRLASIFRPPVHPPGTSSYPPLGPMPPPGQGAVASDKPPGGRTEQVPYRSGAGGVGYPTCAYCPSAEYSKAARKRRLEGIVVLDVIVQPDGSGTDLHIVKSPDPELSQMAIDSVSRWRFNPARLAGGQAVPVHVPIEVTFRLAK